MIDIGLLCLAAAAVASSILVTVKTRAMHQVELSDETFVNPDHYSRRPLAWGAGFAVTWLIWRGTLDFLPAGSSYFRNVLDILSPISVLAVLGSIVRFAAGAIIAAFQRRFRRSLSMVSGLAILVMGFAAAAYVPPLSPYYWYVLWNKAHFEAAARSTSSKLPLAITVLETRDNTVWPSFANPGTSESIVYDGTDEIGLEAKDRSPQWLVRNESLVENLTGRGASLTQAQPLFGHFYLLHCG